MRSSFVTAATVLAVLIAALPSASWGAVRIKDLARFDGANEGEIMGYGLVVGLSGTGDSKNNFATLQSVSNMLREFGLNVPANDLATRNVAAVLVTSRLPDTVRIGDKLDINVAAIGDARSLSGGTLLMTPLLGVDRSIYAMAQGPLSVGGFRFEQNGNLEQKNHATSGTIPEGAIAKRAVTPTLGGESGALDLVLHDPDYTTARRVAAAINDRLARSDATAVEAGRVRIKTAGMARPELVALAADIEDLAIEPDSRARVVVNERTGTIVAGGNIWISAVSVTQGDIRVSITQRYNVSQPRDLIIRGDSGIRTAVVPETHVDVREPEIQSVNLGEGATIEQLVDALRAIRASARDVIAILQGIKRAGALHAELIVQ
jgi:flagellar P-ring protein precursor FlgI